MNYAFDTNTVIHLMIGTESVRQNRDHARNIGAAFYIPPFVQYEIDRGLLIKPSAKNEQAYAQLLNNCELCEMATHERLKNC